MGSRYISVDIASLSVGTESRSASGHGFGEQGAARWKDLEGVWELLGSDVQIHYIDHGGGLAGNICQNFQIVHLKYVQFILLHLHIDKAPKVKNNGKVAYYIIKFMEIPEKEKAIYRDNGRVSICLGPGWGDTWESWGHGHVLHLDGGGDFGTLTWQNLSKATLVVCVLSRT